jgi:ABC-type sugar transport system permease subunit
LLNTKVNSASALSTITFIFIFAISLLLVRLFNANIIGAQRPTKGAK